MELKANKERVRRFVEAINERDGTTVDELATGELAVRAKRWVQPFDAAFSDFRMEIAGLVAEGDTVVAHLRCSGTHTGEWLGIAPTGRRFEDVDEVYVFRFENGRLIAAFGVEDNLARIRQLGLSISAPPHPSGEAS